MDAEIRQRLLHAEEDLLSALSDETLLLPFHSAWSKLEVDLSDMKAQGVLTKDTLALADVVALRISTVVQCYLDIQRQQESLRATFASSGKEILMGLCPPSMPSNSSAQSSDERCSSFIATTSKWLLEHIHNPYPSPQFKASVAEACDCSQSSVNSWFINARRRIGWTHLCREQFRNCRADAVDAAYRALVRPDPARPLSAAIIEAFLAVKADAEGLYSSFTQSATAVDLDTALNDMTDYGAQRLTTEGHCQQAMCRGNAKIPAYHEDQRSEITTYPSPFSSPPPPVSAVPTLVYSLSDESDDEDQDVAPPILAGRKRRANLSENQCTTRTERAKRLCIWPSPIPSTDASDPPHPSSDERTTIHASLETRPRCVLPRSRKRRLSEGTQCNTPKHPHGLPVAPRPQVVSDPLPRTTISNESNIEDWFHTNFQSLFDPPTPVECSDPDPTTQWEVLFGGYSIPSASLQSEPHSVLQDVQQHGGDFSGSDNLFLPLGNEACEGTLPGTRSPALHLSLGGVPFLDEWVTFCESPPQRESVGIHRSSELGFFEFPDLSASQLLVESQAALALGDIGLPVGA
ncbi:C-terminal domain of homeodomain 1-domain-containing protein [Pisolithus marmoratus]|nr:C-terminal domain of homeodomain 1-domain-containing protein [Pisolithus marmoratus]